MKQTVAETTAFAAAAKKAGLTADEREAVIDYLSDNPKAGDLIPGAGGARKLRWAVEGKGKSGGYRVITYFADASIPVFLISVYAKSQKTDLSGAERTTIRRIIGAINEARKGNK